MPCERVLLCAMDPADPLPEDAPPKFKVLSTAAAVYQVQGAATSQYRERRLSTLVCGDSVVGEHSAPGRHPMPVVCTQTWSVLPHTCLVGTACLEISPV